MISKPLSRQIMLMLVVVCFARASVPPVPEGCGWSAPTGGNRSYMLWRKHLANAKIIVDCQLMCKGDCQSAVRDSKLHEFETVITSESEDEFAQGRAARRIHILLDPAGEKAFYQSLACSHCQTLQDKDPVAKARFFLSNATLFELRSPRKRLPLLGVSGWLEMSDGKRLKWFCNSKWNFGFIEVADGHRTYLVIGKPVGLSQL